MTVEFKYTNALQDTDSELVKDLYYDESTGQIAVCMQNGQTYVYQGKTYYSFTDFTGARSLGQFYNNNVRNKWSRNTQYLPEDYYVFIERTYAKTPAPVVGKTETTINFEVDADLSVALSGDYSASEFIEQFRKQYGNNGLVRVVSRVVTQTEEF